MTLRRNSASLVPFALLLHTIGCAGSMHARAADRSGRDAIVALSTLTTPSPVTIAGAPHLVYEVLVQNASNAPIHIQAADVCQLRSEDAPTCIATSHLAGADLRAHFHRLAADDADQRADLRVATPSVAPPSDPLEIPAGRTGAIYLWLNPQAGATALENRVTYRGSAGSHEVALDVAIRRETPVVVGPPLAGGLWVGLRSPTDDSPHRRTIIRIHGRYWLSQRFAIDFGRVGPEGAFVRPGQDASANASMYAYGENVIAVADATVVATHDGVPENGVGDDAIAVPITLDTIGGNYVILDLGNSRFAFYAHMQPGSLRVHVGDHVTRGQVLGLLGNSGNSSGPHLHFHVSNAPSPLESDGIPYAFDQFDSQPARAQGETAADARAVSAGPARAITNEMIAPETLVRFR